MEKEKFISLLSKKLSGELVGKDLDLLEEEIQVNAAYASLSSKLENYIAQKQNQHPAKEKLAQIWKRINVADKEGLNEVFNDASPIRKSFALATLLKIAAILVVCLGIGFLGYRLLQQNAGQQFETTVAGNQKTFRLLDDGTKIWLNKNSMISYNKKFGKYHRDINLLGEAYFDVVKNKDVPLIIHVGDIDIEVKGTAFNVNANKENTTIQVALLRGQIQVTNRLNPKNKVVMKPNEKLIFDHTSSIQEQQFTVQTLTSNRLLKDITWVADTLTFHKEKLKDLAVRMQKKYDLRIEIKSEQLSEKRFSGTFTTETIQQALEALKLSYPLTYSINNRIVTIRD